MLEMTFAESPGNSVASHSADGEPEVTQGTKHTKSNAMQDIYGGKIPGVFNKVSENIAECCVCV